MCSLYSNPFNPDIFSSLCVNFKVQIYKQDRRKCTRYGRNTRGLSHYIIQSISLHVPPLLLPPWRSCALVSKTRLNHLTPELHHFKYLNRLLQNSASRKEHSSTSNMIYDPFKYHMLFFDTDGIFLPRWKRKKNDALFHREINGEPYILLQE